MSGYCAHRHDDPTVAASDLFNKPLVTAIDGTQNAQEYGDQSHRHAGSIEMTIASYGLAAFVFMFGGGILGLLVGRALPEKYHSEATQKVLQTSAGMISILAALVLGLLVATAKNKFDASSAQVEAFAANLMSLNGELVNYGPETNEIRSLLGKYIVAKIAATWPQERGPRTQVDVPPSWQLLESVEQKLRGLTPQSEPQRSALAHASQMTDDLMNATWQQVAQESDHVQHPFIIILMVWLFLLFLSFGLFAPRDRLVVMALFVCALSIAAAVRLIVDLDSPFQGIIVVSPDPMYKALAQMYAQ